MRKILYASALQIVLFATMAHAQSTPKPETPGVALSAVVSLPHHMAMSSPSALDRGANSNYPLDPAHTVPIMSSPSADDHGANSNYPLDPRTQVAIDNGGIDIPNNGGPVQSRNSMP
jgi:hypothetical protein